MENAKYEFIQKNTITEKKDNDININEITTLDSSKKNNYESKPKKIFKITKVKIRLLFYINKKGRRSKLLNRKKKNILISSKKTTHLNDSYDNMTRKIKSWVISSLIKFINEKLKQYKNGKKIKKERLFTIVKKPAYSVSIKENSDLLNKEIYKILNNDISNKVKNKDKKFNYKLINQIINDKKYKDIIDILNLPFLNCINHFIGKENEEALNGFEKYYSQKKKDSIINYKKKFEYFVYNIEKYYNDYDFRKTMNNKKNNGLY